MANGLTMNTFTTSSMQSFPLIFCAPWLDTAHLNAGVQHGMAPALRRPVRRGAALPLGESVGAQAHVRAALRLPLALAACGVRAAHQGWALLLQTRFLGSRPGCRTLSATRLLLNGHGVRT